MSSIFNYLFGKNNLVINNNCIDNKNIDELITNINKINAKYNNEIFGNIDISNNEIKYAIGCSNLFNKLTGNLIINSEILNKFIDIDMNINLDDIGLISKNNIIYENNKKLVVNGNIINSNYDSTNNYFKYNIVSTNDDNKDINFNIDLNLKFNLKIPKDTVMKEIKNLGMNIEKLM